MKHGKIIIVGQIPPPFHGQSVMIKAMVDGLDGRLDYELVPMRFSQEVDENGDFGFGKLIHLVSLTCRVLRLLWKYPGSQLYYPPAPPKWSTIFRDIVFLSMVRPFARKTVFHFHAYGLGEFLAKHRMLRMLGRAFYQPDVAIVLGPLCRKDAELLCAKKVAEIPYGIDIVPAEVETEPAAGELRILFVGLHIESKGILDLLDTAERLKSAGIDFVIHTVGPWKNELIRINFESRRRALGLEDCVLCLGELTGRALWMEYAVADLFFFPTFFEFETFGLVVVEAMAYGLPVISSDWRGPGDIVENGVTGFVCRVHDSKAYADSIISLANDSALRASMGAAGRSLYEKTYTNRSFIDSIEAVFCETIGD